MLVSYDKLFKLLDKKGETVNSLSNKGVLTNYSKRMFKANEYPTIDHFAKICRYFDVPIEDIVEVIPKSDSE